MSSRYKGKSSKGSGSGGGSFPTGWSQWEWNAGYNCDVRYRLKSPGDYEYQYGPVQASDTPVATTTNLDSIAEYPSHNNYTATPVDTITRVLEQTSLAPVAIQQSPIPRSLPAPSPQGYRGHIRTRDENTTEEQFDPNYKVHGSWEFQWGRVFKVLWAEPSGNGGGSQSASDSQYSMRKGQFGEKLYQKVRRFVIVDPREGHCICLPIMTYSGQGVNKRGVHAADHTIIWTEKPVRFSKEKEKGLQRKPIRVKPAGARHKLDDASRLNYAKLYTVEYNVKVWFVGKIHSDSEYQLTADYNLVHPPMASRGQPPTSAPEHVYEYAEGAAGSYQSQTSQSLYTASVGGYTTSDYPATSSGYQQGMTSYATDNYPVATMAYSNVQVASYPATSPTTYEPTYSNPTDPFWGRTESDDQPSTAYDRESHYD